MKKKHKPGKWISYRFIAVGMVIFLSNCIRIAKKRKEQPKYSLEEIKVDAYTDGYTEGYEAGYADALVGGDL